MKRAYTQYQSYLKTAAKKNGESWEELAEYTAKQADIAYKRGVDTLVQTGKSVDDVDYDAVTLRNIIGSVDIPILTGTAKHIFLTDIAFCDWMVDCVKDWGPEHAKAIMDYIGTTTGVLHFPIGHGKWSVAFSIPKNMKNLGIGGITTDTHYDRLYLADSVLGYKLSKDTTDRTSSRYSYYSSNKLDRVLLMDLMGDTQRWYVDLIIGLGMYIKVFPETVKNGPPDDLKHPSHHDYRDTTTIGISPKVCVQSGTHASPIMHYRAGHYNHLVDPRFTRKRGQWVFVSPCYVNKGNTITVLSPEEVQNKEQYVQGRIDNDNNAGGDSIRQAMRIEGCVESGDQGNVPVTPA